MDCSRLLEKSRTLLKAGSLMFYPLHITVLIFSKRIRLLPIFSGRTVLGNLAMAFHSITSDTMQGKSRPKSHQRFSALCSLHECIEIWLKTLAKKSRCGHAFQTESGTCILLRHALTSYVADNPKTKELLGIKRGG